MLNTIDYIRRLSRNESSQISTGFFDQPFPSRARRPVIVGRDDAVAGGQERIGSARRFVDQDIKACTRDDAAVQGLCEVFLNNEPSTRRIDQKR